MHQNSQIRSALKAVYSPYLHRAGLEGRAALQQMADDLRTMSASAGGLTEDDLMLAGWTRAQINRLGTKARDMAFARAERVQA